MQMVEFAIGSGVHVRCAYNRRRTLTYLRVSLNPPSLAAPMSRANERRADVFSPFL